MIKRFCLKLPLYLLLLSLVFTACDDDDNHSSSLKDETIAGLTGTWKVIEVTKDDMPRDDYENFILVISDELVFETYGDPFDVFPVGSFEFVDNTEFQQVICQGKEIDLTLDGDVLTAFFSIDDSDIGGRMAAIHGEYVFTLESGE